jgi:hypothetical protein
MKNAGWLGALVLILVAARIASPWIGHIIGLGPSVTMLGLVLVAYAVLATVIAVKRRRLARWLSQQSPDAQEALRMMHPEFRYLRRDGDPRRGVSIPTVMWLGFLWIYGPLIPWFVGPMGIRQALGGQRDHAVSVGLLVLGFVCAWSWWSVNVTLWRRWAERRGIDPHELQWAGEEASILWPKGHVFQRTEWGEILDRLRKARSR